ncbi:MAG TPA: squalene/phytoene synthase family protein, partial [Candidatus Polarisedimenticolaceae bacterium]|nr:squalene/phytoene synthase family protein [Candidatus Polarisedimenticolaceae bacterium]
AAQPPLAHAGYLELLGETPGVLAAYAGLAPGAREAVGRHTIRTAELMAAFVARKDDDGVLRLRDAADLAAYCYAVAGIVGEMLTELFLLDRAFLEPVAPLLRANAASFGEALQLVNILKDASADAREGRSFLPATLERGAVFARARGDLAAARDYVLALQRRGAPRGLIEFCALPVLLARATLERVEAHGPGAKLTRPEVAALVVQLDQDLSGGRPALS